MMAKPHEVESTLLICSAEPGVVADRVAGLDALPGFLLLAAGEQAIRDVYFDREDRPLQAARIALRLRDLDGLILLTLKADSGSSGGVTDRIEIEAPWSTHVLGQVVGELAERQVPIQAAGPELAMEPVRVLAELGFEAIQERETRRSLRDVVRAGDETVAEMAIDLVSYPMPEATVRLHEIEVEAKGSGSAKDVEEIVARLTEMLLGEAREWPYGKLATGMAIQSLLVREDRADLVDPSGTLIAPAYQRIEALLASDGVDS